MQEPEHGISTHPNELDLQQADDIRINDTRLVMRGRQSNRAGADEFQLPAA